MGSQHLLSDLSLTAFKMLFSFKCFNGQALHYLVDLLHGRTPASNCGPPTSCVLMCSEAGKKRNQAFVVAAPKLWNSFLYQMCFHH